MSPKTRGRTLASRLAAPLSAVGGWAVTRWNCANVISGLRNVILGPSDVILGPSDVILGPFNVGPSPSNVILGLDPRISLPGHLAPLVSFLGESRDPRVNPEDDVQGAEVDVRGPGYDVRGPGGTARGAMSRGVRPWGRPGRVGAVLLTAIFPWVAALFDLAPAAMAQVPSIGAGPSVPKDAPVTFTADQVEYDREHALVTARGHVEAWQAGRIVRADQMTFNRDTGVVVATGNVVLTEPDGQVMFAQYAELSRDMTQGIMKTVRGVLDHNGRLAANGMRRTGGLLNELSRVVYSACDLCAKDPTHPPLWQIEAASAVQDTQHKTIEYHDAVLEMDGIPVAYTPWLMHPDPSVPRQSGILPPLLGTSSSLGAFYGEPYYWVIDGQSDATITPFITTHAGAVLDGQYRHRFNDGTLFVNLSAGYRSGSDEGSIATRGQFSIDDTWRWGFDINRASSSQYVLNQHILLGLAGDSNVEPSNIWLEGLRRRLLHAGGH